MRICRTYGEPEVPRDGLMTEYRADVFGHIPDSITDDDIITLCGRDPDIIPEGFGGLVDAGVDILPGYRCIRSFHDFSGTPDYKAIVSQLKDGPQEISKGAYTVRDFTDLLSIRDAARSLERRHVILGMGPLGTVTRIRQNKLGNEFTFAYSGRPTAPGQLDLETMSRITDDTAIIGILGHPVAHSLSPVMQNAAMAAEGIDGIYLGFDSPDLEGLSDFIREYDILGMNVTIPYKTEVMDQVDEFTESAETIGAVNTVINRNGTLYGANTDPDGILFAFSGMDIEDKDVLVLGSGGAARSAVFAMSGKGCEVSVLGRNRVTVEAICNDMDASPARSNDPSDYDIVINCTPVGMRDDGPYPINIDRLTSGQTVLDMVYNRRTPLAETAEEKGCTVARGSDMLIGQGARSFRYWFGRDPDTEVMREAIE